MLLGLKLNQYLISGDSEMLLMKSNQNHYRLAYVIGAAVVLLLLTNVGFYFVAAQQPGLPTNGQLTGNWAVKTPNADGTFRTTYLNLKQDGSKITGSIRVTQFYYLITESTGGPEGFTLTGSMKDGKTVRTVKYEGKLVGDELHVLTRRRPEDKPPEMIARRVPAGEGALPARYPASRFAQSS